MRVRIPPDRFFWEGDNVQNQEQYDKALKLLEKLEEILGTKLMIYGYDDGEDPREELWRKFATPEEREENDQLRRKAYEDYVKSLEGTPFGDLRAATIRFAEQQLLKHAEPISVLSKFALSKPKGETIKFRRPVPYGAG